MLPFLTRLDCYFYSEALLYIIDTVLHGAGLPIVYSLWIKHRWDTVFPICRSFITFSATSAYLYSCSKELQLKWQAWYYCWMWGTMWGCSCLQLGAAVQEPYLVGIINWWGMCMDQLSKCNCIVHMQRQGLRLGGLGLGLGLGCPCLVTNRNCTPAAILVGRPFSLVSRPAFRLL